MAHPQNSPRGLFAKKRVDVGGAELTYDSTGNLKLDGGIALSDGSDAITQDSTGNVAMTDGLKLSGRSGVITQDASSNIEAPAGISLSGQTAKEITQSANGIILPVVTSAPSGRVGNGTLAVLQNSTGQAIMLNTTGTTWKYLNVTDTQPT